MQKAAAKRQMYVQEAECSTICTYEVCKETNAQGIITEKREKLERLSGNKIYGKFFFAHSSFEEMIN